MKWFDKMTKKFAKSATSAVKEEVKEVALDILPTVLTVGGIVLGVVLYKNHIDSMNANGVVTDVDQPLLPSHSTITITTNNYYYGSDLTNKLIEGEL